MFLVVFTWKLAAETQENNSTRIKIQSQLYVLWIQTSDVKLDYGSDN